MAYKPRSVLERHQIIVVSTRLIWKKALGKQRVCDISMAVLHRHYQKLQRVSLEGLRKAMGIMNQVMEEAMRRQLVEMSPTLALKPKIYNATPNPPRERWLPIGELQALWSALEEGVTGGGALAAGGAVLPPVPFFLAVLPMPSR